MLRMKISFELATTLSISSVDEMLVWDSCTLVHADGRPNQWPGRVILVSRRTLTLAVSALSTEITQLLKAWSGGDQAALNRLVPAVYGELRRIARGYVLHERAGQTLQATALVN